MSWIVSPGCDTSDKPFGSRSEAESAKATHLDFCDECEESDVELFNANAEVVESGPKPGDSDGETDVPDTVKAIDDLGESLGTDPLDILPGHMIDNIQNEPAINKRGYSMIAERYGIEVSADVAQFPWDNEEGRAVARATAITEDGKKYSGWATAAKDDGDMADQLIELAETRALKRAVSWASGVGIVSYAEMVGELKDE